MSDTNTKKTIQELIIEGETYVFNATYLKNGDSKFDFSDVKTINGEAIIESGGGDIVTPITYGEVEGSAVLKGGNNTVTGKYSAAIGYGNTVKNDSSVAFGYNNKVKANCCFSAGSNNEVSGENSHVSGRECIVEGHESHAEGNYTKVYGHCSHGEGTSCRVLGDNSHVEGHSSVVYGHIGHAEGQYCAAGDLGQIEKPSSERTDAACHAEGIRTTAKEMASHSEGIDTHSMGVASHAEGRGSYTSGDASHAEGLNTKSGIKGFYFKGIDIKNKKIYLSTTKPDTIKTSGFSTSDFENIDFPYDIEEDMLSIINGNIYYDCLKVTQIKNKSVIYVESLPFTSVAEFNELFKNSNYTIFCLSKYKLGVVSVSFGCHSEGYETRSFGFGSHSDGYNTIAKNIGEHASGIYNVSNGDTQFSIGVGTSEDDRKNAFEVKKNGDIYIGGVSNTLQSNINNANDAIDILTGDGDGSVIKIVKDEIAKVVDSAPEKLDTLKEISDYITSNAADVATTLSNHSKSIEGLENDSIIVKGNGENSVVLKGANNSTGGTPITNGDYERPNPNTYSSAKMQEDLDNGLFGKNATAEGQYTMAVGPYSHTEGTLTYAEGLAAHAEGHRSAAIGNFSHAEGNKSRAIGKFSHAEGNDNWAEGWWSHVEGSDTKTTPTSRATHAEGYRTIAGALDIDGTAETKEVAYQRFFDKFHPNSTEDNLSTNSSGAPEDGIKDNTADGSCSHAEGHTTHAHGRYSHAEGSSTAALGDRAHAEGWETIAYGTYSHAEGLKTIAKGEGAHAEGGSTQAKGARSHTEGFYGIASGYASHAEGIRTVAEGQSSHAEGNRTKAIGNQSHSEGLETIANGTCSHAEGYGTITNSYAEHASGKYNVSNEDTQFSIGIGSSDNNRKNAFEVKQNGDIYIEGIGGFIGDNYDKSEDVATVINQLVNKILELENKINEINNQKHFIVE